MTIPSTFPTAARQSTAVILGLFLGLGMSGSLASDENGAKVAVDAGEKLFDPANRPLISYRDFDTYLSVVRRGERLSVLVEAYGRIGSPVDLPDEFAQVDQIQKGPDDKAIVLGRATGLVSEVAIIDIRKRSLLDHFWAYQPKSSPNGRWIAFVKFFPAHGAYLPEDQYRLYDLTRTPQENRPVRPDLGTGTPSPTV
jgi:hypothetical protein